jgi:hypothetical protein
MPGVAIGTAGLDPLSRCKFTPGGASDLGREPGRGTPNGHIGARPPPAPPTSGFSTKSKPADHLRATAGVYSKPAGVPTRWALVFTV